MGGCACIRSRDLVAVPLKDKIVSPATSSKVYPHYGSQSLHSSVHGGQLALTGGEFSSERNGSSKDTPPQRSSTLSDQLVMAHEPSRGAQWLVRLALQKTSVKYADTSPKSGSGSASAESSTSVVPEEYIQAKFLRWDVDGDGLINKEDLDAALKPLDLTDDDVAEIFRSCDADNKGYLDYDDFLRLFKNMPEDLPERRNVSPGVPDDGQDACPPSPTSPPYPVSQPAILNEELLKSIMPGSLGLLVIGGENVPKMDWWSESDPYVVVEVFHKNQQRVASSRTYTIPSSRDPTWNQMLSLPAQDSKNSRSAGSDLPCSHWECESTIIKFTLFDEDYFFDDFIGECTMPLLELLEKPVARLLLWDKQGESVLGSSTPCMPCEIAISLVPSSMPAEWKAAHAVVASIPRNPSPQPYHVFMMTRGTRGDVQPFVALARGLASELGWTITICTELRWKKFVKSNANVRNGKIRFRPSGGDTENKMSKWWAQWAVQMKSELMQLTILAASECEFFSSATVFVRHLLDCANEDMPVDLVVFGLTVARVASLISELFDKPMMGFILQPSCIPSTDAAWPAVQPLHAGGGGGGGKSYTSHKSLQKMKTRMENNRFAKYNVQWLRKSFGLEHDDTYRTMRIKEVPLIIPMRSDTFSRPTDWWDGIILTDFIFLRNDDQQQRAKGVNQLSTMSISLGSALDSFLAAATHDQAKVCLMTFSSMPVTRKVMLACSMKMLEECKFNLRLIYVGKKNEHEHVPHNLEQKARHFTNGLQFLELERADFGMLFKQIHCFIVHGGLGTTVEALRMQKPCIVTGPLLLDQRFWGNVCHQKGVGPEPVHIDNFESHCVHFVNGALDPADPHGWQAMALSHDWGLETDDGLLPNVTAIRDIVATFNNDKLINKEVQELDVCEETRDTSLPTPLSASIDELDRSATPLSPNAPLLNRTLTET